MGGSHLLVSWLRAPQDMQTQTSLCDCELQTIQIEANLGIRVPFFTCPKVIKPKSRSKVEKAPPTTAELEIRWVYICGQNMAHCSEFAKTPRRSWRSAQSALEPRETYQRGCLHMVPTWISGNTMSPRRTIPSKQAGTGAQDELLDFDWGDPRGTPGIRIRFLGPH